MNVVRYLVLKTSPSRSLSYETFDVEGLGVVSECFLATTFNVLVDGVDAIIQIKDVGAVLGDVDLFDVFEEIDTFSVVEASLIFNGSTQCLEINAMAPWRSAFIKTLKKMKEGEVTSVTMPFRGIK